MTITKTSPTSEVFRLIHLTKNFALCYYNAQEQDDPAATLKVFLAR